MKPKEWIVRINFTKRKLITFLQAM